MEVTFIKTNKANLSTLPIVDGQIIALKDANEIHFDLDEKRYQLIGLTEGEQTLVGRKYFNNSLWAMASIKCQPAENGSSAIEVLSGDVSLGEGSNIGLNEGSIKLVKGSVLLSEGNLVIDRGSVSAPEVKGTLRADFSASNMSGSSTRQVIRTHYYYAKNTAGVITTDDYDSFYVNAIDGIVHAKSTSISGLDYAEYIYPWADNNENKEDRTGYFVTVKDQLLYKANEGEHVLGITSETFGTLGTDEPWGQWHSKYERDNLGRILTDENGYPMISEDFDFEQQYENRDSRPEWSPVGLRGQLHVYDDGTCIPGQFCKCADGGIATFAEGESLNTWFVLERVSENTIKIMFK